MIKGIKSLRQITEYSTSSKPLLNQSSGRLCPHATDNGRPQTLAYPAKHRDRANWDEGSGLNRCISFRILSYLTAIIKFSYAKPHLPNAF